MVYVKQIKVDNYDEFLAMTKTQQFTISQQIVETVLNNSEDTGQKRSANTLSGININRFTPLVKCLEGTIQNPENIVQAVASDDWVRGGAPSRQMLQDQIYLEKCGYNNNDGDFWSRK